LPLLYMLISVILSGVLTFMILFDKEERGKLISSIPLRGLGK
jgi:hypothetical protein